MFFRLNKRTNLKINKFLKTFFFSSTYTYIVRHIEMNVKVKASVEMLRSALCADIPCRLLNAALYLYTKTKYK